jgi:hypothetical protein
MKPDNVPFLESAMKTRQYCAILPVAALIALALAAPGCSDWFRGDDDDDHDQYSMVLTVDPSDVPKILDITWAVKEDATALQLNAYAMRIQQSSNALWAASHGQIYLRNVTLTDKTLTGDVVLDNLNQRSGELAFAYTYQLTAGGWEVHLGGNYPMQAFIHEMGHAEVLQDWQLPEEYDLGTCDVCAMDAYQIGSGEGKVIYCDGVNCTTSRQGCWPNVILVTHPNWTYPNTPGPAPTVNITIQDN